MPKYKRLNIKVKLYFFGFSRDYYGGLRQILRGMTLSSLLPAQETQKTVILAKHLPMTS